ncbi:hypothetical protein OU994_02030 [Pseudoduganella sp. SL102]|uniref:Uncharacterized protein n=1 Tax=Pseudoduganella albidiflava TaxID=321983 RepID=A0AA87XTJ8_9BURK|nr:MULTISPECIES: hypothetical protein [Pseudoduganella]WBS03114.1 hypothetical protein OU994_02030 [Pseudoduganella sp. SL102]GGY26365.1 hypothetical protein GCM10007387_05440 [Pseudoduganella albidiflava]
MKKFWIYGIAVVFVSTVLSWTNMGPRTGGFARTYGGGSTWSSNTGGGGWGGGGGGHK